MLLPSHPMTGTYNALLVLASFVVAAVAAYAALSMTGRITANRGRIASCWLVGGACVMGLGVWSMHFIGMLAFKLPIPQGYDLLITGYSLLIAVGASGYALWMVTRPALPSGQLLGGGLIMGCGVAAMHYVGMAAMRMQPGIDYDPLWFSLSVLIAIAASISALWIFFRLRSETRGQPPFLRIIAAAVMGFAIAGMHYTGMAAARFPAGAICGAAVKDGASPHWLASLVGTFTFAILGIALVVSMLDRRLQERTTLLTESLIKARHELTHLAMHDSLTRLPNRALMETRLSQAIDDAQRGGSRFAVMFIDLDGFKGINDTYGHEAGDQLLLQLASSLMESLRPEDTIARLGGDEFVVLTTIETPEDAASTAQTLLRLACLPLKIDRLEIAISASIGVALYPDNGLQAQELLAHADAAMYAVKERGRNGYQLFKPDMRKGTHQRITLAQDLRQALDGSHLQLDYRPRRRTPEGPVLGLDALVRWRHPQYGQIPPADFIPLAEHSGLSLELGRWVLEEACRQLALWRSEGHLPGSMAVSLSPTQFRSELLHHDIKDALQRHDLPGSLLVLGVSESVAMHDPAGSLSIFKRLSDLGVSLSIDDFYTGYASLTQRRTMPASELAIDRDPMRDATSPPGNAPTTH
ncbi:MHYT domain-containing protein [Pseudoxanthomonas sp.]|uniref:putative bifunctional diguanylate cyclase/phosphodiesterase n=1 Tax=Pseudoxanthomonas sp. TaxID=1871049 RepID=UPI002609DA7F|nr:MHYT domain-containing protein [Pseudoxanthomonas sp.]WDS37207.1 MAG: diguanylate cyclase [Pseudoxanthomonas sp.]